MVVDIPASSEEGKNWISSQLINLTNIHDIRKIVDIGCGAGTYYNYFNSILPNCHWTGVDIWEPYITEYNLEGMYNKVIIGDASSLEYDNYDIAFVGDVLEHMPKEDAVKLIEQLVKKVKFIFISIPIVYYPSEHYVHNPYLRHVKPDWSDNEVIETFGEWVFDKSLGKEIGTYVLSDEFKIMKGQISKEFVFLSGLPRTGSTVLSAILNQHPMVYVTPTSPLLDQLIANQNIWHNCQSVMANPVPVQLDNLTRRLINGMWEHISKPVIIDKNRGWMKNVPASEILFRGKIKMIAMVRSLPDIMASWLSLLRKNPDNYLDKQLRNSGRIVNDYNRMDVLYNEMVKDCMEGLAYAKRDCSSLLLVEYDRLVSEPELVMSEIGQFIGIEPFEYDFDNIVSLTVDDDLTAWGLNDMHNIRPKLSKISKNSREILGEQLFEKYSKL